MGRIVLIPTPNGDKTRHPRSACEVFAALFSPFFSSGEDAIDQEKSNRRDSRLLLRIVLIKMSRMNAHHHPHLEALQAVALDSARNAAGSPREAVPLVQRRRISSQALMGNDREVEIEHAGSLYRLRVTSLGKLILTK
jgi:hemin uptake protein HemP